MQSMIKRSKDGVPELNIRPIDPLIQEKSNLQFENNFVQGKMALRNVRIVGLSKSTVDKTEFERNGDKVKFTTYTRTPKLQVDGSYKAEVFVNNNKMSSKGIFNVTISKFDIKIDYLFFPKNKNIFLFFKQPIYLPKRKRKLNSMNVTATVICV